MTLGFYISARVNFQEIESFETSTTETVRSVSQMHHLQFSARSILKKNWKCSKTALAKTNINLEYHMA